MNRLTALATIAIVGALLGAGCATQTKELAGPAEAQPMASPGPFHAEYVTTTQRAGVRQPFVLFRPEHPKAAVILFTGSDGILQISPQGIKRAGNFLIRSRFLFAEHDLLVAAVDFPSDRGSLYGFRSSQAHALDIKGVISYLREQAHVPVWLVGTSRGTVSAIKVADWLADDGGPDGVVLTSSYFDRGGYEHDTVFDADPVRVRVPLLVVHNRSDLCPRTKFDLAEPFIQRMTYAHPAELIPFEGGGPVKGDVCEAFHYHGFPGLEPQVVDAIATWILAHPPK